MAGSSCLPVLVPPLPGESLPSLVVRSARAMAYDHVDLLLRLLERPRPQESLLALAGLPLERLARLLDRTIADLRQRTVHTYAAALVLRSPEEGPASRCDPATARPYVTSATAAVCGRCLESDPVPYERLLWHFRPLPVCLEHGCLLLSRCPACRRLLASLRKDPTTCPCGQTLLTVPAPVVAEPARLLARELTGWLTAAPAAAAALAPAVRFWLLDRLMLTFRQLPALRQQAAERFGLEPQSHRAALCWLAAADVLHPWPEGLHPFLAAYQQLLKQPGLRVPVNRAFSSFFRATVALEARGYPEPAQLLRRYLAACHGSSYLTGRLLLFRHDQHQRLLAERPWCTQQQAAARLGVGLTTSTDLLARDLLVGQVHAVGPRGRSLGMVQRSSVERLRQQLRTSMTLGSCGRRLGIGRSQLLHLLHERALHAAVRTRRGWRILPHALAPLEQFLASLPLRSAVQGSWLPWRQATRTYGPAAWT